MVQAFPCMSPPNPTTPSPTLEDFASLLDHCLPLLPSLLLRIPGELEFALDGNATQAQIFCKRFGKVAGILHGKFDNRTDAPTPTMASATTHSVFFAAMIMRACEILDEPASPSE